MGIQYDFLIVGAGLFGATFAHEATKRGKRCLVIDRRTHIAGNTHTAEVANIQVHTYGAHIFHTNDKAVWAFVNQFAEFNQYVNSPIARYGSELYNLPFNMNTFYQLWGVTTPQEAIAKIASQRVDYGDVLPKNLEEQALALAGYDIYEKLIKGYTEKQWGRACVELPASIIKRVPFRLTFNNNYFNARYQGIPIGGYTKMVENMLKDCEVQLGVDYGDFMRQHKNIAQSTVYTGAIDEFFDYSLGVLEYRSLRFETEIVDAPDYQGNAVVNYTTGDVPYTRIIEHKHFEFGEQPQTVITREYPAAWTKGMDAYYPINNEKNTALYQQYRRLANELKTVYFGGRLGDYAYYDMDRVIAMAIKLAKEVV